MSNNGLKPGWRMVKFGDVVKNANIVERDIEGAGIERIVGLEHLDSDDLHIRRWSAPSDGTSFTRKFVPGQTLFGKRRAYLRKVAYAEFDGICSGDILTFEPKDNNVLLPELLPFICQTDAFFDHALETSAGSLSPRTSWKAIKGFEFALPPIKEQKRIAEILWTAEDAVEGYKEAISALLMLRTQILRCSVKDNPVQEMPCSSLYSHPPRNGYSPKTNASGQGSPTLSIGAIREGRVVSEGNTKFAEISSLQLDKFRLKIGDVLVVRGNGNKQLCGRAGLVREIPTDCFYPDLLIRLCFDKMKILPEFAVAQWNDSLTHAKLLKYAKSTNGIWKVNGKDLRQHQLLVPDIYVQREIVEKFQSIEVRESELARHIQSLQAVQRNAINEAVEEVPHVQ